MVQTKLCNHSALNRQNQQNAPAAHNEILVSPADTSGCCPRNNSQRAAGAFCGIHPPRGASHPSTASAG
ncbi:unnamed protein product [Lampetra fluviatilis]